MGPGGKNLNVINFEQEHEISAGSVGVEGPKWLLGTDSWESNCCGHGVGRDNAGDTGLLSLGLLSEGVETLPGCRGGLGGDPGAAHIPPGPLPGAMAGVQERSWPGSFSKESNLLLKLSD